MNTKRRVLSFLMALVMVLGVMAVLPITINAADANASVARSVDIRKVYEFLRDNDYESYKDVLDYYKRVEYIPYANTSPTLDGAIGASEYTVTNPIIISTFNTGHGQLGQNAGSQNMARTLRYANEYFAQDEDYVYFAFVLPNISHYSTIPYFYFDIRVDYSNYTTGSNRNAMQKRYNGYALQIQVNTETGVATITNNGAGSATANTNMMDATLYTASAADTVKYTAPTAQDTNGYVEYKISKELLMRTMKVTHLRDLSYGLVYWSKSGSTQQCNFIANMADQKAANIKSIADRGWYAVYRNVGIADLSTYDDNGYAAGGNSTLNVREDLVAHGFKSYTINGFASPVADGVINTNEYTLVENNPASDKKNNATGHDLVEYFAHDEDYVYYAFTAPYVELTVDGSGNPTNNGTNKVYIRIKSTTGVRAGDNYHNSFQLTCVAAENAAESTFNADGERNYSANYTSHKSGFTKEDFAFVGKIDTETNTVTYELRIDRAKLAAAAGTAELDHYAYYVACGNGWNCYDLSKGTDYALEKIQFVESALGTTKIAKNVFLVDPNMQTMDVGSVRIDTAETSGLRFQTIVSKAYLAEKKAEGYTVTAGTLIAPEDFNIAKHTDGTVNEDYIDVVANLEYPYDTSDKYITFTGAIVKINPGNLDRDFTAIGYLALTKGGNTEYVYSNAVTKNVSEIAQAAIASGKYNEDPDALEILNGLLAN